MAPLRGSLSCLLTLGLIQIPLASCQTYTLSAVLNTVGFIVYNNGSQPTPLSWTNANFRVTKYESTLETLVATYVEIPETRTRIPFNCGKDNSLTWIAQNGTSSNIATASCDSGCASVDVIATWPSDTETWTYYDCLENLGEIDPSSLTIFRVVPPRTAPPGSSSIISSSIISSSTGSTSSTTTPAQSTSTQGGEDGQDDKSGSGGGPSTGVIAGVVVGAVAAVALIATAFWLGFRLARRRAPTVTTEGETAAGMGGYVDTMRTVPGGTSSAAWAHMPPPNHEQQMRQPYHALTPPVAPTVQSEYEMSSMRSPRELWAAPAVANEAVHNIPNPIT